MLVVWHFDDPLSHTEKLSKGRGKIPRNFNLLGRQWEKLGLKQKKCFLLIFAKCENHA
jgi:hypothetical protein